MFGLLAGNTLVATSDSVRALVDLERELREDPRFNDYFKKRLWVTFEQSPGIYPPFSPFNIDT